MRLIIFEDEFYDRLYPISYLRPVFELKCGTITLRERIEREFENPEIFYFMRDYLVPVFSKKYGANRVNQMPPLSNDDLLIINGRLLALDVELASFEEGYFETNDQFAFAFAKKENLDLSANSIEDLLQTLKSKLPNKRISATLIDYPWNLVQNNSRAIKVDFDRLPDKGIHGELSPQAAIVGDKNLIHIAEGASVRPFVTLDTTNGPIIIDKNAIIHPMTHIEGPNYTGENTYIFGGNIREGCSFGPVCRLHGEIEESIIHGYSNKHHDGFLGHAYLGEWVNLGAFTTNSDLKNDYSTVQLYVKGELTDSRDMKVGSFIGDHTKTSIGTIINTGAMIGVMSNVVGSGKLIPKFVPSFCWYLNDKVTKGRGLNKMLDTARKAMSRRGVEMTDEDEKMFRIVYEITKEERTFWIKKSFA